MTARRSLLPALGTVALLLASQAPAAIPALGVELPPPDEAMDYLAPASLVDAHPRWTVEHRRESAAVAGWLVWPSVTVGGLFDSNPFQKHRAGRDAWGFHVAPTLLAERESGVARTTLYAAGDIRLFPGERGADTDDGRAGVLHDWLPTPDAAVRLQGEVARRTDPFENAQVAAPGVEPGLLRQTDVLGSASIQKSFDQAFVVVAGSALHSSFDGSRRGGGAAAGPRLSDETVLTLRTRIGYWFGPSLFAFAEPAGDRRILAALPRGYDGTRTIAGLGAVGLGLLSGDIYGGWQTQAYPGPRNQLSEPVFGGRLAWAPRPGWTVVAQTDRTLGDVAVATAADPLGTPIRQDTALLRLRCAFSPLWTAEAALGAIWLDYVGTRRRDRLALADLRVDYAVSRSVDLTAGLRLTGLASTFAVAAYGRAAATLGASYHY